MQATKTLSDSNAYLSADHASGATATIPSGTQQIRIVAIGADVYYRLGGSTLAGIDVQTRTESTTAADGVVVNGEVLVEIPDESDAKVAVRTATGTAKVHITFGVVRGQG